MVWAPEGRPLLEEISIKFTYNKYFVKTLEITAKK